jgi:hypothetical protein
MCFKCNKRSPKLKVKHKLAPCLIKHHTMIGGVVEIELHVLLIYVYTKMSTLRPYYPQRRIEGRVGQRFSQDAVAKGKKNLSWELNRDWSPSSLVNQVSLLPCFPGHVHVTYSIVICFFLLSRKI